MKKSIFIPIAVVAAIASFYYFSNQPSEKGKNDSHTDRVSISKDEYESLLIAKKESNHTQVEAFGGMEFIPLSDISNDKQEANVEIEYKSIDYTTNTQETIDKSEELVSWSKDYQKELFNIVDENMPTHTADFMKLQLSKNSFLLNNSELKQDLEEDDNWAFLMEDNIRSAIEQHELKPDFDILSIKCKQLSCEVMGIERAVNTWHSIYVSLISTLPNAIFPSVNDGSGSYSVKEGVVDYSFSNISFKKS